MEALLHAMLLAQVVCVMKSPARRPNSVGVNYGDGCFYSMYIPSSLLSKFGELIFSSDYRSLASCPRLKIYYIHGLLMDMKYHHLIHTIIIL